MDETKYRALVTKWNVPPPGTEKTPAQAAAEGASFMAFMGAHQALRGELRGGDA